MQYAGSTGWRLNFGHLARSAAQVIRAGWTAYARRRERIDAIAELRTMDGPHARRYGAFTLRD